MVRAPILVLALASAASALNLAAPKSHAAAPKSVSRRDVAAAFAALSTATLPRPALAESAARAQWNAALKELDAIVSDFDAIQGGGDGIRRRLGTVGTTSPLFQIEKACQKLLGEAEDPAEFADALEEFMLGVGRVDGMAYSSNFAGGSGKPSENSAATYIARSKKELVVLKVTAAKMDKALGK